MTELEKLQQTSKELKNILAEIEKLKQKLCLHGFERWVKPIRENDETKTSWQTS